jgi:hypothetical protein
VLFADTLGRHFQADLFTKGQEKSQAAAEIPAAVDSDRTGRKPGRAGTA